MFGPEKRGRLIMDEVDLLLHPLKSELNFPIGPDVQLEGSPWRWDLPIRLLDVVLRACAVAGVTSATGTPAGARADKVRVNAIASVLQQGLEAHVLQRLPHLVLLDKRFYARRYVESVGGFGATWCVVVVVSFFSLSSRCWCGSPLCGLRCFGCRMTGGS